MTVIQLAKLSGFSPIIVTASKSNEAYLKSLGATHVIDRREPLSELPQKVKEITSAPVTLVYDAVSQAETQNTGYEIVAPGGGLVIVLQNQLEQSKLTEDKYVASAFGIVQDPGQREMGKRMYAKLTHLLETGDIKVRCDRSCDSGWVLIRFPVSRIMSKSCPTDLPAFRTGWRD